MVRRCEGAARHFDQESGRDPDPDSRHAGQDRMKRDSKHETFNLFRYLIALDTQGRQLLRQMRRDDAGSLGAQNRDGLLGERLDDIRGPRFLLFSMRGASSTSRLANCFWVSVDSCAGEGSARGRDGSVSANHGFDC